MASPPSGVDATDPALLPAPGSTVTDATGHFELLGMPPGRRSILVSAFGHHTKIVSALDVVDGREVGPVGVALSVLGEGESPSTELAGVGAVLAAGDDALLVLSVVPGSGAESAGILAGDGLVAVDGRPVTTLGFLPSLDAIRGPPGTHVQLQVRRGTRTLELSVERRKITRR